MYSRYLERSAGILLGLVLAAPAFCSPGVLRVCADPNNLPFSSESRQGFENRLASMLARDLGAKLEYVWWPQRKNFIESSLNAGHCDVLLGVPAEIESAAVTRPYYRSSYVFVSRTKRDPPIASLFDERLAPLRIGIHVVDDDYAPPAQVLARRGLSANLAAFSLYGSKDEPNPPARLIEAVARGDLDIAIAWGPLAGYFASNPELEITPVAQKAFFGVPFVYAIALGVRKQDDKLRRQLDQFLGRRCADIQKLLNEYRVPQVLEGKPPCASSQPVYASSR